MTKSIKILLISLLTALFSLCIAVLAMPGLTARADDITTTDISDDNFSFVPGAAMLTSVFEGHVDPYAEDFDIAKANTTLRFMFKLENFNYENFSNSVNHPTTFYGYLGYNVFIYEFTLYCGNHDGDGAGNLGTANPQNSVMIVIFSDRNRNFYGYVAEKNYYGTGSLTANWLHGNLTGTENFPTTYDYIATEGTTEDEGETSTTYGRAYTITQRLKLSQNNLYFFHYSQFGGLVLPLYANVNSPFSYYFIKARYHFTTVSGASMFDTSYSHDYGEIYSSSRSVANILYRMNEQGVDFDEEFGDRAVFANQILATHNTQRVRIKYLTEIEGTPYATHNYAYVDVPVWAETIHISDVETALGLSLNKCLDSNASCFQKTTDTDGDVYQLYYLKNVWLRTATVDGNYFDYFLDINDSYKDVYRPYVNAGILTNDIYEWIYSTQIINKFPELQNYRFNEIYGYFGLVVVPETYTLNSSLKTFFDINTSKIGVISNFVFERSLSYEGYQQLLNDYNYGFLSKLWSNVAGFVSGQERNATYYLIYSEPGTEKALIGEGGQTDQENPGSVVENEIIKPVGGVVGNVWYGAIDFLTGLSSNTKTILWIALGVLGVVIGIKVYISTKGITNSRRKRK